MSVVLLATVRDVPRRMGNCVNWNVGGRMDFIAAETGPEFMSTGPSHGVANGLCPSLSALSCRLMRDTDMVEGMDCSS